MTTTLWRGRNSALVETHGRVDWYGDPSGASAYVDRVVDVDGVILPAFRDAHVHVTQTGLALTGLDLHGATSLADALDRLARHARTRRGGPILGTGWDESRWPEMRPPTKAELDRASFGGVVYLSRVDEHGAVASSALLQAADVTSDDGWVTVDDHHRVRAVAYSTLTAAGAAAAQQAAIAHFATQGIAEVHECAGPQISGLADLEALLDATWPIDVVASWGDLMDVDTPRRLGLRRAGGDLFCDGSFGSRTAALSRPYADAKTSGFLKHDGSVIRDHVLACLDAGLGAGFHAIGDNAIGTVLEGFEKAAVERGVEAVRGSGSRIEHCEMADHRSIERMAELGLEASVQPQFDSTWGGADGMYAQRLGPERARGLNPFAAFHAAGVPMLFGSDTPVCPVDPWAMVRAAVLHNTPESRLDVTTAFGCATLPLGLGTPATFAVWAQDGRDDLDATHELVQLVVRGQVVA